MSGFVTGSIVSETLRNIASRRWLALAMVLTSITCGAALVMAAGNEVASIENYSDQLVAHGSNVFSVVAQDNSPISAARCDALNSVDGVLAAGAIVGKRSASLALSANVPVEIESVTPHYPKVVWPGDTAIALNGSGFDAGSRLGSKLGFTSHSRISLGPKEVAWVRRAVASSPRVAEVDSKLLEPVIPDSKMLTNQCLVEAASGTLSGVESLLGSWFPPDPVTFVSPLVKDPFIGEAPQTRLDGRITQNEGLVVFTILAALILMVWLVRRSDFALYRILGMDRRHLAQMLAIEFGLLVEIPLSAGTSLGILLLPAVLSGTALEATSLETLKCMILLVLVPLLGLAMLSRGGAIRALKES